MRDCCGHSPSMRMNCGLRCDCKCHDVADAAPDLLAALKAMHEWFCGIGKFTYQKPTQADEGTAVVRQALAAIAKAEGRT